MGAVKRYILKRFIAGGTTTQQSIGVILPTKRKMEQENK